MMMYPGSLHNHSEYSNLRLRDSINKANDLIDYAIELGHEVIAITEHETISNAVKVETYYNKIKEKHPNFKVILGNEIYLVRNGLTKENFSTEKGDRFFHFILLARDAVGHKQLRELSTRAWLRSWKQGKMTRVPTYYQDLIDIIGANPGHVIGSSACFVAGTKVETKQGWKNIEDIQAGDFVINRYGKWEEVIEPTSRFTQQNGYEIELTGNEKPIVCTDNHQFLVISNRNKVPRWVQAKDLNLKPGNHSKPIGLEPVNYCYFQKPIIKREEWNDSYFKETKYSNRKIKLPDEIVITPELMRLFGLFLGDGCITLKSNPCINFTFNENEFDCYMNSFFEKASKQLNIDWYVSKRHENHRVDVSSGSVDLINLFYFLFGNVKANNKYFPDRLRISKELDYELIFGYLLADGYFRTRKEGSSKLVDYKWGEFVSASISKNLSYGLYKILNQLHITSSITYHSATIDRNKVNHQESWYVSGSNQALGAIKKLHEYSHEEVIKIFETAIRIKNEDFITIDGIDYRKIRFKKATLVELNEQVYCLNNTTHSFKCENLIVHNCLGGLLPTKLLQYRQNKSEEFYEKIKNWIVQMQKLFGKSNFYLEMQPSHNEEQIFVNKELIKLSKELGAKYIITTDSHYMFKDEADIHKAYLNSQDGEREVDSFYATTYMMGDMELKSFFEYLSEEELQEAYQAIVEIKNKCEDYSLKKPLKIPNLKWRVPKASNKDAEKYYNKMNYLKNFIDSEYDSDNIMARLLVDKLEVDETLNNKEAYDELNECLKATWISSEVNKARWSAYFINLQNILDVCWRAGSIVGAGRGSGVGFLLLYALDLIQINPMREKTKTKRWRFLNPERVSVLDLDTDISGIKRSAVLQELRKEYGEDRVANVVTFGTETSKAAIQTAGRGIGLDNDITLYVSSLVPVDRGKARTLKQCYYGDKENDFRPVQAFVEQMDLYPELWKVAQRIESLVCRVG